MTDSSRRIYVIDWTNPGPTVREIREARGFTIRRLAEISGVDHSTIFRIESREGSVKSETLYKIFSALGVDSQLIV